MDARTIARIAAVQALYEQDIGSPESAAKSQDVERKLKQIKELNDFKKVNKKIFEAIIASYVEAAEEVNGKIIANLAEGWTIERIGGVLRSILRAAIAERRTNQEFPKPVLVSEYINITSSFYGERETKFVNALLDKVL